MGADQVRYPEPEPAAEPAAEPEAEVEPEPEPYAGTLCSRAAARSEQSRSGRERKWDRNADPTGPRRSCAAAEPEPKPVDACLLPPRVRMCGLAGPNNDDDNGNDDDDDEINCEASQGSYTG